MNPITTVGWMDGNWSITLPMVGFAGAARYMPIATWASDIPVYKQPHLTQLGRRHAVQPAADEHHDVPSRSQKPLCSCRQPVPGGPQPPGQVVPSRHSRQEEHKRQATFAGAYLGIALPGCQLAMGGHARNGSAGEEGQVGEIVDKRPTCRVVVHAVKMASSDSVGRTQGLAPVGSLPVSLSAARLQ